MVQGGSILEAEGVPPLPPGQAANCSWLPGQLTALARLELSRIAGPGAPGLVVERASSALSIAAGGP